MALLQSLPEVREPAPGVVLQVLPEPRFKRARLHLHFDLPLDAGRAARTLLIPVLQQGCRPQPSRRFLSRALQEAYGAAMRLDAERAGERHRVSLTLSWVGERFLPPGTRVLPDLLQLADALLRDPLRGDDGAPFDAAIVARERDQVLKQIASLQDDRSSWAEERFLATMCEGEPYGLQAWDSAAAVSAVTPEALESARETILRDAQMSAFATGPVDGDQLEAWLRTGFGERTAPPALPPVERHGAGSLREVREQLPMDQAQFHFGFRYRPSEDLAVRTASGLAASILGGGAHGRLFRVVREQRSLAYGIYAVLRSLKGLMTVSAGIDAGAYEEVRDEVQHQIAELASAGPTADELELARTNQLDRLRSLGDAPQSVLGYLEREHLLGTAITPAERAAALQDCTAEQIAAAASAWQPDTVYLLEPAAEPAAV